MSAQENMLASLAESTERTIFEVDSFAKLVSHVTAAHLLQ